MRLNPVCPSRMRQSLQNLNLEKKNPPFIQNPANANMDILGMSSADFNWWLKMSIKALDGNATVNKILK